MLCNAKRRMWNGSPREGGSVREVQRRFYHCTSGRGVLQDQMPCSDEGKMQATWPKTDPK